MTTIITDTNQIKVQPDDIDTTQPFWDAFGRAETEISAKWIVRLCQELGGWKPFTKSQIQSYYTAPGRRPVGEEFYFNGLDYNDYIVHDGTGGELYYITVEFVTRCYKSSPKVQK